MTAYSNGAVQIRVWSSLTPTFLGRLSGYFKIFSFVSEGGDRDEESEAKGGWGPFYLEIEKGGFLRRRGGGGAQGLGGCLGGGWRGAKYFFWARNSHQASGPQKNEPIHMLPASRFINPMRADCALCEGGTSAERNPRKF